jgi:hypothetical protein
MKGEGQKATGLIDVEIERWDPKLSDSDSVQR